MDISFHEKATGRFKTAWSWGFDFRVFVLPTKTIRLKDSGYCLLSPPGGAKLNFYKKQQK